MANLESSITVHGFKLELKLFGFNEKLPVLVRRIMEFHQSLVVTPELFQVCRNELSTNSLQRPFFLVVFCLNTGHKGIGLKGLS
jgi:secreted Zn-dependent insulinase-like peptidase